MNRNIAFLITSNNKNLDALEKAKNDFFNLVEKFKHNVSEFKFGCFEIFIAHADEATLKQEEDFIEFPIGNLGSSDIKNDRFLKIIILKETIKIENDYAGTIPVFYSKREYLSLSNIESCVMLDSKTIKNDFSYENIYGYMRYMHFIWDETAYKHISTMLPDSLYVFDAKKSTIKETYLKTVKVTKKYIGLSDIEISNELNKLNDKLVYESLEKYDQVILPLSSGYDSRMILVALAKRADLKNKLHCFTYGSIGSVEVEAARQLTSELGVKWDFIDLPLKFLTKDYLHEIHDIFGASLHMHGMYQLEFFNEISKKIKIEKNSCLTSGFMTGVPAGQHNTLLGINNNESLTVAMNKFSQSRYWTDEELNQLDIFKNKKYIEKANERFKLSFNRFEGEVYQKSVMFDVWTRQRNFIGYYPRTLEWKIPTASPHMNKEYANLFMSISKKHLDDRLSVELMFSNHYPRIASIVSNSNGLKSINSLFENMMFFTSRVFRKFKINCLLPNRYMNNSFEFNLPSLKYSNKESIYPLLLKNKYIDKEVNKIISHNELESLYLEAYNGDISSYEKMLTIQSIGLTLLKMEKNSES